MDKNDNLKRMYKYIFFQTMMFERLIWMLYLKSLGWSVAQISVTQAILNLSQVFCEIPSGLITDKIGSKRTILVGHIFIVIYLCSYSFASEHVFMYLGFFLYGVGLSMISGADQTLVYNLSNKSEFGKNFGKYNAIALTSIALSTFFSGLISEISWSLIFGMSIFTQSICIFIMIKIKESKTTIGNEVTLKGIFKTANKTFVEVKELPFLVISIVLFQSVMSILDQYTSVFFNEFEISNFLTTTLFTVGLLGAAYFSKILFKLINFFKEKNLVYFGFIGTIVLFSLYNSNKFTFIAFSFIVNQWVFEIVDTTMHIQLQETLADSARNTMISIINSFTALAMSIESLLIGYLAHVLSIKLTFVMLGVGATALALTFYYKYNRMFRIKYEEGAK